MSDRKSILVLCTGNSARSQMAEGLLKERCGEEFDIFSAGTHPGEVRPEAIKAMADLDIDISRNRSKSVDEFADMRIDFVVTVCDDAHQNCPYFPAQTRLIHHSFEDPAAIEGTEEVRLREFRKVRDQIKDFIPNLLDDIRSL